MNADSVVPPFIPILVISLPDSTERRETVAARLDALSLPFEFVDAVDGRNGLSEEHEAMVDRDGMNAVRPYPMSDAEFACSLSHLKVYRRIVDDGIPHALVLEDDAVPQSGLPRYLAGRHFEGSDLTSLFYGRAFVRPRQATPLFDGHTSYPCEPGVLIGGGVGYVSFPLMLRGTSLNTRFRWSKSRTSLCARKPSRNGDAGGLSIPGWSTTLSTAKTGKRRSCGSFGAGGNGGSSGSTFRRGTRSSNPTRGR